MSIQFRQALSYPFLKPNRKAMVWLPGAFGYAVGICYGLLFLVGLGIALMGGDWSILSDEASYENPLGLALQLLFHLGDIVIQLGFYTLGLGYCWRLAARLQRDGLEAPGPAWLEDFPKLLLDGLKAGLYYIVISMILTIPTVILLVMLVVLLAIVFGLGFEDGNSVAGVLGIFMLVLLGLLIWMIGSVLLGPFVVAPLLRSAQKRDLEGLFHPGQAWRWARQEYRAGMTGMLYVILMFLVYGLGSLLLVISIVGILLLPFLILAPYASLVHLLVQAMPLPESPAQAAIPGPEGQNPTVPQ